MTVTQRSLGDFGDDLTLDPDVVTEAETREVTLQIHCGHGAVRLPDQWKQAFNLAGVFAYDCLVLDECATDTETVSTLRFHYGLTTGDEVHPPDEWNQRLRLSGVHAYEVVVVQDRKVKRQSRYAMEDRIDDIEDPDDGEAEEP